MTAEIFTTNVRPATTFSPDKHNGGSYKLTAQAVADLGGASQSYTVADILDILSTVTAEKHEVTDNSIGFASSVLNWYAIR